jgi:hypothetical protein
MPWKPVDKLSELANRHQVGSGPVTEIHGDAVVDGLTEGQLVVASSVGEIE